MNLKTASLPIALLLLLSPLAALPVGGQVSLVHETIDETIQLAFTGFGPQLEDVGGTGMGCPDDGTCTGPIATANDAINDTQATTVTLSFHDGSAAPGGETCSEPAFFTQVLPADPTANPDHQPSCVQVTIATSIDTLSVATGVPSGSGAGVPQTCLPPAPGAIVCIDIDATPLSGVGCDGREWHGSDGTRVPCTDNTINEDVDHDGDGTKDATPTWIFINFTSEQTAAAPANRADNGPLTSVFADGRGIVLKEIHVKWPHDNPEAPNAVAPSFATFATEFSNVDNDDDTDFQEALCSVAGLDGEGAANPTNPYSDCNDFDGDGIPNGEDGNDALNQAVQVRVRTVGGSTDVTAANAPAQLDAQFICNFNPDQVGSAILDLGHSYLGPVSSSSLPVPRESCGDGLWHSVSELTGAGNPYPVYHALKTETAANQVAPAPTPIVRLTVTTKDGYTLAPTASFTLTPFDALQVAATKDRTFAPISFVGSKVTCILPAGLSTVASSSINLNTLSTQGDDLNGSPNELTGSKCSPGTGTVTSFQPIYYAAAAAGQGARSAFNQVFQVNINGANPVMKHYQFSVSSAEETGTLAASCTPACTAASTSVAWTFTPGATTLSDEEAQPWDSVELTLNGNVLTPAMSLSGGVYTYSQTRDASHLAGPFNVRIVDDGNHVTTAAATAVTLGNPNAAPTITEHQAPQELAYSTSSMDVADTNVTTLFTARVSDLGPAGYNAATAGDTFHKVEVRYWETDAGNLPATQPTDAKVVPMRKVSPAAFGTTVDPLNFLNGASKDGELYNATIDLAPGKSYRYCYFVQDAGGLFDDECRSLPAGSENLTDADAPARPLSSLFLNATDVAATLDGIVQGGVESGMESIQALVDEQCGAGAVDVFGPPTLESVQDCAEKIITENVLSVACATPAGPLLTPCGGSLGNTPVLDPLNALTGGNGCNFSRPWEWDGTWSEGCNRGDLNGVVTAIQDFLTDGDMPDAGLPVDESDPQDRDGDGREDDANGQVDLVERRAVALDPDEAGDGPEGDDPSDRFDGATAASGLTIIVFSPTTATPTSDPTVLATVRLGDVAGTDMTEILVIEQGGQVTCVVGGSGLADVFVYRGATSFRANGDEPEEACGPQLAGVGAIQVTPDVGGSGEPLGLMVWTDADGDGKRTNDADNGNASKAGDGDVAGFRIVPNGTDPLDGFTAYVNDGTTVTAVPFEPQDVLDGLCSADGAGPVPPGTFPGCVVSLLPCDMDGAAACVDADGDNVPDFNPATGAPIDNCPGLKNDPVPAAPSGTTVKLQPDQDNDGKGDACDDDVDGDTVLNATDNCPVLANTDQANHDGDAEGDLCDGDDDNDLTADGTDLCSKGLLGAPDSDTSAPNGDFEDPDDGCKNSEDDDDDNDGVKPDASDSCPRGSTGAASGAASAATADPDVDGCKNSEDSDDDADGVVDGSDNCPTTVPANPDQANHDGDASGDACDTDDDNDTKNDGVTDNCDRGMIGPFAAADNPDNDGCHNDEDADDDGDGVKPDASDPCPRSVTQIPSPVKEQVSGAGPPAFNGCFPDEHACADGPSDACTAILLGTVASVICGAGSSPEDLPGCVVPPALQCMLEDGLSETCPDLSALDPLPLECAEEGASDDCLVAFVSGLVCSIDGTEVAPLCGGELPCDPEGEGSCQEFVCSVNPDLTAICDSVGPSVLDALCGQSAPAPVGAPITGPAPFPCGLLPCEDEACVDLVLDTLQETVCAVFEDNGQECPELDPNVVCEIVADPGELPECLPLPLWVVDCLAELGDLTCFDPLCSTLTGEQGPVPLGAFPACLLPPPVGDCVEGGGECPLPCGLDSPDDCVPSCSPTGLPASCGTFLQGILSIVIKDCPWKPLPADAAVCFATSGPQGIVTSQLGLRPLVIQRPGGAATRL